MPLEPNWDPGAYRSWLKLQARLLQRDPRLRPRLDDSDLVQETLARAHTARDQCRARTEGERLAWLQAVLHAVVQDQLDRHHASKRDVARERSVEDALGDASRRLDTFLHATQPAPGEQAMRRELWRDALAALERLPPRERDVVIACDVEGLSLRQVEAELGVPRSTAADLLVRGRRALARLLAGHQ
jgi:RNA polymerase sigma-70 factor (ECF subfamily)